MSIKKLGTITIALCNHCSHEWVIRGKDPDTDAVILPGECSKCCTANWNRPLTAAERERKRQREERSQDE